MAHTARLIARWMGLGFIHGVMNTDNVSIAGETLDYGPCAFMDSYHPDTVYSAIDQYGRYAYSNQPGIGAWNMAQFATALIPLMPDREGAITDFTERVHGFQDVFDAAWLEVFGAKLGISDASAEDRPLITDLLALMADEQADFTRVFAALGTLKARDEFVTREAFDQWEARWQERRSSDATQIMTRANPLIIPRNHRVEEAIAAGVAGNFAPFHALLAAVTQPFTVTPETERFTLAPSDDQRVTRTFCGT